MEEGETMSFLDKLRTAVKKHDVEGKAEQLSRGIQRVGSAAGHVIVAGGRGAVVAVNKFQKYNKDKAQRALIREKELLQRERISYERAKLSAKMKVFRRTPY